MSTCYTSYDLSLTAQQPPTRINKDYSRPLHVDCSVEYELPSQAKPPPGTRNEPLLMIHPCYFRKMESQHRSPFVNNLPNRSTRKQIPKAAVPQQRIQQPSRRQQMRSYAPPQYNPATQIPWQQPKLETTYQPLQEWTTNTSPLQAERFPEQPQVTLQNTNLVDVNKTGKYRQYLRTHRLHPYMSMAATAFPQLAQQMQQISCYNV